MKLYCFGYHKLIKEIKKTYFGRYIHNIFIIYYLKWISGEKRSLMSMRSKKSFIQCMCVWILLSNFRMWSLDISLGLDVEFFNGFVAEHVAGRLDGGDMGARVKHLKKSANHSLITSVSDPVHFFRIRIRVTPKRPDPTRSGSLLDMFLMCSKINNFFIAFSYQI